MNISGRLKVLIMTAGIIYVMSLMMRAAMMMLSRAFTRRRPLRCSRRLVDSEGKTLKDGTRC